MPIDRRGRLTKLWRCFAISYLLASGQSVPGEETRGQSMLPIRLFHETNVFLLFSFATRETSFRPRQLYSIKSSPRFAVAQLPGRNRFNLDREERRWNEIEMEINSEWLART